MQNEVRALLILQDRDRRLSALKKDLEKIPADQTRAKQRLAADETTVAKAHQALLDSELRVKKIELDAETRRTTIKRLKLQQFETRKNEEFVALGHEIVRYEKELDGFETLELEAMEEVDGFRKAQKAAEADRELTRVRIANELLQIEEKLKHLQQSLTDVTTDRAKVLVNVPEGLIPLYNRLMKSKEGYAIAALREDSCQGCHMKVISSTKIKAATAKEITQCENCGRILYIED